MEKKEIRTILVYKRPHDSWLCPECDTENSLSLDKCMVCGCRKTSSATILKQWTEADDRTDREQKESNVSTDLGQVFKDTDKEDKVIWGVLIGIILFILLMIGLSQAGDASVYDNAMNEYNSGYITE